MSSVIDRWRKDKVLTSTWDAGVKNERFSQLYGIVVFGTDNRRMYSNISRLGELPAGTAVLDTPCGGGLTFRALRPEQRLRYVAADLSPIMLERARAEAARRKLDWVEVVEADVQRLPFEDEEFDLCVTYNSLHCLPDQRAALTEMVRVLRPGGELRGTAVVWGAGKRQDTLIGLFQRMRIFDQVVRAEELEEWLTSLLDDARVETYGSVVYFSGRRPGSEPADRSAGAAHEAV